MSKLSKIILTLLSAAIALTGAVSCSAEEPPTEEEIISVSKTLLENAVEVNRIFFWEGLPHVEPSSDKVSSDFEYLELTEEYMFLSENDLLKKAEAVYSEKYCSDIKTVAFEGIKVSDDDALYARYVVEEGIMKINRKLSEEGLSERLPKTDTVVVEELGSKKCVVRLSFESEGVTDEQTVTLVKDKSGWRLDTPTY